jgi:hypothetical protein
MILSKFSITLCAVGGVHSKAKKGKYDRSELKKRLQGMRDTEKCWVFSKEVTATYTPDDFEKILEEKDGGSVKYVCYALRDNPNASFIQAGMEKSELEQLINQL